jgi:hypothetical protein
MRERTVEQKFVTACHERGWLAAKFVSPGMAGVPDRIVFLPGGRVAFAELKAPGKTPTPMQRYRHRQLRELGFTVHVVDNPEDIETFIREVQHEV